MDRKELIFIFLAFILTSLLFFYKTFLSGLIPIPGDLLISEYNPWRTYSYLGYVPGSFPSKVQYFDVIRQLYPWKVLAIDIIKSGEIPFWNPYNFSGSPLLANFQSSVFYPLNALFLFFPEIISWSILVIIQPLFAGFFTYLFAREIGISKTGSFFSSIGYSYSLFMTIFVEYNTIGQTILWLPLLLFLIEKILKRVTFWKLIFFTVSISSLFFAGHLQIASFTFTFVFIYAVFRILTANVIKKKRFYLLNFLLLLILGLGISSVQLFPTFELINFSARTNQNYQFLIEKLLIQPYQLIVFLSPDFFGNPATRNYLLSDSYPGNAVYIGLIPFIFSLFAVVLFKRNYFVKFFTLVSLILFLLFIRSPLTEILYSIKIPFFSTGSPTNAIFLLSFSLSILSGFGLEKWIKKTNKSFYIIIIFILLIFIFILLSSYIVHFEFVTKNFYYSLLVFSIFLLLFFSGNFLKIKNIVVLIFISITIFDLFYFFHKFNPFVPIQLVFPKTEIFNYLSKNAGINRFWGYGNAEIQANFSTQYSLFSPDGYDPLYPRTYGEFMQASSNGKIGTGFNNQTRSDAIVAPGFGEKDLSSNFYRLRILDTLGIKYVLDKIENGSTEKTFPSVRFKKLYDRNGWIIFENIKASPRVFLTTDYKTYKNKEEFEKIFFSKNFDPSKTILLEESVSVPLTENNNSGSLSVVFYEPNKIIINTQSDTDKLFFLSDTYYPGWKAYIDNKETKIYKADYAFRAIVLPGGNHKVVFKYLPQSFYLGVKLSIISIIILLIISVFQTKIKILK